MTIEYKFVELSVVTEESLEQAVNHWVGQGWQLDGVRFVTTDASRRPAMAFISFVRPATGQAASARPPERGLRGGLRSLADLAAAGGDDDEPLAASGRFTELDLAATEGPTAPATPASGRRARARSGRPRAPQPRRRQTRR